MEKNFIDELTDLLFKEAKKAEKIMYIIENASFSELSMKALICTIIEMAAVKSGKNKIDYSKEVFELIKKGEIYE